MQDSRLVPVAGELATTTAMVTATVPAASAATATLFARLGFVDRQRATIHVLAVELGDGLLGLLVRAHLDKREPTGLAGEPIEDQITARHGADLGEQSLEVSFCRLVREIADV